MALLLDPEECSVSLLQHTVGLSLFPQFSQILRVYVGLAAFPHVPICTSMFLLFSPKISR